MLRCFLLIAVAALAAAADGAVSLLDGGDARGQLAMSSDAVTVAGKRVALADCDALDLPGERPLALDEPGQGVWLADGSWLPATGLEPGATPDSLKISGPLGDLEVPLTAVRGWAASVLPTESGKPDLVIGPAGPVAGRVVGLVAGGLRLATDLDPEPVTIPLSTVIACRIDQAVKAATGLTLAWRIRADRPALRLRPGVVPGLVAAPAVKLAGWDLSALAGARLRVDGGRRVWLSDLRPDKVTETGAFGVVWPWRRDTDLDGGPLVLGGILHAKGISVHSAASLVWRLDGAYARFSALVGIADLVAPEGDCLAQLVVDGKAVWSQRLRGGSRPLPVTLELPGAKLIELRIDTGERYDIGDHVALGSAFLVRK
ncbi:hypothetical protein LBMAG53_35840 [Planctomycetota bacterium]|nr:hypothetical protein LBMAG53_35840 [Planctomycetota bacterium]